MAPTTSAQYAAAQSEMLISWWRDWTRFLEAQITLNTIQQQRMSGTATTISDAFDKDQAQGSVEAQERQANAALDRIPAARRSVFDAELHDRVQALQQAAGASAPPLTAITRQALDEFTEQAYGRVTTGEHAGLAGVPCEGRVWFTFAPATIDALPPEAAWSIARPEPGARDTKQLVLRLIAIAAVWIIGGGVYYLWFRGDAAPATVEAAPALALVNGAAAAPWAVRAVVAGETTLAVAPLGEDTWPAAPAATAGWRRAAVWPAVICLPKTMADALPATLTLLSAGAGLDRTYTLSDAEGGRPDLRVVACGSGDALASGTLQMSTPPEQLAIGAQHTIPQLGDLMVTRVTVEITATAPVIVAETAATAPAIAAARAQVVITLAAPAGVDWPAWLPTLRFIDGSVARSASVTTADGLTTLTYDVPASVVAAAGDAVWQITVPQPDALGPTYRWNISLIADKERG